MDTEGLPIEVHVHAASVQDRDGGPILANIAAPKQPLICHVWADSGYEGRGVRGMMAVGWTVEIVRRSNERGHGKWTDSQLPLIPVKRGFQLVRRRWVVERTFGWLGRSRRLSKDYEQRTDVSEACIWLASLRMLLARLAGE